MKDVYTLDDLRNWPTVTAEEELPLRLGVFGDPIAHSLSPQMHNAGLAALGIPVRYCRLHIPVADLREALGLVRQHGFIGVNLTIPHKLEALGIVDEVDSDAQRLGAVNTVVVDGETLLGFNTDGPGIARTVRAEFDVDLSDLRVLVLGAGGGAGRAAAVQCALSKCQRLVLVNRTVEKLAPLKEELSRYFRADLVSAPVPNLVTIPWEDAALARELPQVDLIINASSVGMKRTDSAPLPAYLIEAHHLVYDMVYGKGPTKLRAAALESGGRYADGLSMLLYQGALSFEHWFQRPAPLQAMKEGLRVGAEARNAL
jgi:shikimate dehydrogenase